MRTNWRNVFWIIFIWQCLSIAYTESYQFCGEELARVVATVCANRGYNTPISPEPSSGYSIGSRFARAREVQRRKRGIVDECCKAGCSWSTLEQYCRPAEATTSYPENLPMRKRSDLSKTWKKDDRASSESPSLYYNHNRQLGFGRYEPKIDADTDQGGESRRSFEQRLDSHANRIFTTIVSLDNNADKTLINSFKNHILMPNKFSNVPEGEVNQVISTASGSGQSERASLLKFIGQQDKPSIRSAGNDESYRRPMQVGTAYPYFMSRKLFSPTYDRMLTSSPQLDS